MTIDDDEEWSEDENFDFISKNKFMKYIKTQKIKGGRLYPKKDKMIFAKENVVLKKIKLHASYPLLKNFPMDKRFSIWLSKPKMYFWWEGIRLQTS